MKELHLNRPGAIGDIIMTLQAIHKYKQLHPEDRIIYYCDATWQDLPKICPAVDEVKPSAEFDINIPGAQNLYGYADKPLKKHLMWYFGRELGLQDEFWTYGFKPNFISEDVTGDSIITIHPSAGWSPYKNWSIDKWQKVVTRLQNKLPKYHIIQIGKIEEPELRGVTDMRGRLSITESINLIKKAKLHLGIDSFSNHATALLPLTPAVILWGSTHPMIFGYGHNINIWHPLKCSPCNKNNDEILHGCLCVQETPCIDSITVDEVYNAAIKLLGEK